MPQTAANMVVSWPQGAASTVVLTAADTAQTVSVTNRVTIVDGVTNPASGNRAISVSVDSEIAAGAILLVKSKTVGTQTTSFATGIDGISFTGVAGKTICKAFMYDGSTFVSMGASEQID